MRQEHGEVNGLPSLPWVLLSLAIQVGPEDHNKLNVLHILIIRDNNHRFLSEHSFPPQPAYGGPKLQFQLAKG